MESTAREDASVQVAAVVAGESHGNRSFTHQEAEEALRTFAGRRETTTEKMIFTAEFEIRGEVTIHFRLLNKLKEDMLNELKQELLDFLRKTLGNSAIQVSSEVTAEESKAKPRTEQEKFEAMLRKNPVLKELKDRLGLDLVY